MSLKREMFLKELEETHRYIRDIFKIDITWSTGLWALNAVACGLVMADQVRFTEAQTIRGVFIWINCLAAFGILFGKRDFCRTQERMKLVTEELSKEEGSLKEQNRESDLNPEPGCPYAWLIRYRQKLSRIFFAIAAFWLFAIAYNCWRGEIDPQPTCKSEQIREASKTPQEARSSHPEITQQEVSQEEN